MKASARKPGPQWLKQQTMLVNENRLNLADQRARQYLARQMENHFFGKGADVAAGYVPPDANDAMTRARSAGCEQARHASSWAAAACRRPGRAGRSGASSTPASGRAELPGGRGTPGAATRSGLGCCICVDHRRGRLQRRRPAARRRSLSRRCSRWRRHWPRSGRDCCPASTGWRSRTAACCYAVHRRARGRCCASRPSARTRCSWAEDAATPWTLAPVKAVIFYSICRNNTYLRIRIEMQLRITNVSEYYISRAILRKK